MKEIWKPVPYKPFDAKYSVSNLGRVKPNVISRYSKNKAEFLRPAQSKRKDGSVGYPCVTLYTHGQRKDAYIHRMVALAFHGEPPFKDAEVCHKDDDRFNNAASNLYWGTHADNTKDREERGKTSRGEGNGRASLTENDVREIRRMYATGIHSQEHIAKSYGLVQTQISRIVLRKAWAHVS